VKADQLEKVLEVGARAQLFHEKDDRYHFAAVSTVEDAGKLIENGYEYVTDMQGLKLFRKAK